MATKLAGAATLGAPSAPALDLEFPIHGGIVMPTEGDSTLASAGPIAGLTPLVRLSRPFAVGVLLEHSRLSWEAAGPPGEFAVPGSSFPEDEGSFQTTLIAPALRWYVVDANPVFPYVQVAIGWQDHLQVPDHPDCSFDTGFGGQLAVGGDFAFASWGRVGVAGAAFPFILGQGCNENAYEGKPPNPPFPGLGVALQMAFTTVWSPASQAP